MDSALMYRRNEDECYYELLGCNELSTMEQILTEYKIRAKQCHPDKVPQDSSAAQTFQKLQKAKEVLCDVESRKRYDKWRRSGICISYEDWIALPSHHSSMHWAPRKAPDKMLESGVRENQLTENIGECLSFDEIRSRFRNYEI